MVRIPRLSLVCGLLALCSAFTLRANADIFTQTNSFTTDSQVAGFSFSTTSTQDYNFYTTSYSGGTNADGTTTAAGGFDPVLSLFNADGTLYNGMGPVVSNGGSDAMLTQELGPGAYILALSEFPNFSDGTLGGYMSAGDLAAFLQGSCGTSAAFTDAVDCSQRTGAYTVNYTSTAIPAAVTPEPPSALLLFLPLAGIVVLNRRKFFADASL